MGVWALCIGSYDLQLGRKVAHWSRIEPAIIGFATEYDLYSATRRSSLHQRKYEDIIGSPICCTGSCMVQYFSWWVHQTSCYIYCRQLVETDSSYIKCGAKQHLEAACCVTYFVCNTHCSTRITVNDGSYAVNTEHSARTQRGRHSLLPSTSD